MSTVLAEPFRTLRGRGVVLMWALLWCAGCGATTTRAQSLDGATDPDDVLDVAALDAAPADVSPADAALPDAPPDATTLPDAPRCDPSVLADAGALPDAPPPDGPYVVDLALDIPVQCARMSDGTLRCRGSNFSGQLGDGTTTSSYERAVEVPGLTGVEQVVLGLDSTCARLRDGTVRCWGSNHYHQLGVGHEGDEDCGFGGTGRACRRRPVALPGLTDVVHLAASMFVYCAVRRDGSVWCWGDVGFPASITARPALTPVPMPGLDDVLWMRAGLTDWIVRRRSGRWEVLRGRTGDPLIPSEATVTDGADNSHICYLLPDTSMRCFGYNGNGKIGNGTSAWPERVTEPWDPGLCGVRSFVTGGYHTCAVVADRRVWCWGDASYDSLGVPATERCVGINHATDCVTRPTLVAGLDQVERIYAGIWGTCAIRADRSVWCWGNAAPMREARPTRTAW